MKAWTVTDYNSMCWSLVFANTRGQAIVKAMHTNGLMYQDEELADFKYIELYARRCKHLDGYENKSEKDICLKLVKDCSCNFYVGNNYYDENNIEEFKKLWR